MKRILSWALCAVIVSSLVVWAAQVAVVQTDTRQEAWAKETLNNSDLQTNIDLKQDILSEGAFVDGDKTDLDANTSARHTQGTDTALGGLGTKALPIDADKAVYRDSTDSDALVTATWTEVKAFLKTYFDTLYGSGGGDLLAANNLSDVDTAATAYANIKQSATDTATGAIERATDTETVTGGDNERAVTPANLVAKMAAPGTIGGTTPAPITGTTVTATTGFASGPGSDPKLTGENNTAGNSTMKIEGASTGAYDIIMSFWVDVAGTLTEFMNIDGVSETVDFLKPTTLQPSDVLNSELNADAKYDAIEFVIDGGGSAITTGVKGFLEIPWDCTVNSATLLADQSGSIVVDVWVDDYANYPPTDADTITSSTPPTITTDTDSQDTTLTSWTVSLTKGQIIGFNVDSITTCERVTLSLKVDK